MDNKGMVNYYVIALLALYFGWLLAFPFYGPVFSAVAPLSHYQGFSLPLIFTFFHGLSLLGGALLLKNTQAWKQLMFLGLAVSLLVHQVLIFSPPAFWPWGMAVLGAGAAVFILAWAHLYTVLVSLSGRLKLMAAAIIGANLVYVLFNFLSQTVSAAWLLPLAGLPLWILLPLTFYFSSTLARSKPAFRLPEERAPLPGRLVLLLCLFIAGVYLCSGFMYSIVQPLWGMETPYFAYLHYLPYLAAMVFMWQFGDRLRWFFTIYWAVVFLGLAFVIFVGVGGAPGWYFSAGLLEVSFALLDLFIWVTLGYLALIYGSPFQFFGYALSVMLFSVAAGEVIGVHLLHTGEHYHLVVGLLAVGAVLLTVSIIPWLNECIQKDLSHLMMLEAEIEEGASDEAPVDREKLREKRILNTAVKLLLPGQKLTPREMEITALLLEGLSNRDIAQQLFISENTLKTHLKNIYTKYGVAKKRELLSLVLTQEKETHFSTE